MNNLKISFLTFLPSFKKTITYLMYGAFACYIAYLVIITPTIIVKTIFLLIGLTVLTILILFEFLKSIYAQMITSLTFDCDIEHAISLRRRLIKYDVFNGFKQSLILFNGLLLLDQGRYQDCLDHIEEQRQFYQSTLDYLLIAERTTMQCAYFLEDSTLFDTSIAQLKRLKINTSKKNNLTPLYSWEEIAGITYFRQHRYQHAQKTLANISTTRFNPREELYLLFEQAQVELALGHTAKGNYLLNTVKKNGNHFAISELAAKKERLTFEKHE